MALMLLLARLSHVSRLMSFKPSMVTRLFEERSRTWLRTLDDNRTSNFEHGNRRLAFVGYLQEKGYNRYGGYSLRIGDDDYYNDDDYSDDDDATFSQEKGCN